MGLFPKNPKFFDLFLELSIIAFNISKLLRALKIDSGKTSSSQVKARQFELKADAICHQIFHEADTTFITPIDREDIHILARSLDNIIDLIENFISNIFLFKVGEEPKELREFAKRINQATKKINQLVSCLRNNHKNIDEMRKIIIEIHSLENEGDKLIEGSFKYLFSDSKDPLFIIKWKDLFENLEAILDECEDTADIIDEIIIKNF